MLPSLCLSKSASVLLPVARGWFAAAGFSGKCSRQESLEQQIATACSQCHELPPPENMSRGEWPDKINSLFHIVNLELLGKYVRPICDRDPPDVVEYFASRALAELLHKAWGPAPGQQRLEAGR